MLAANRFAAAAQAAYELKERRALSVAGGQILALPSEGPDASAAAAWLRDDRGANPNPNPKCEPQP